MSTVSGTGDRTVNKTQSFLNPRGGWQVVNKPVNIQCIRLG